MRLAAKVDANQPEIVEVLRRVGCTVESLHRVGNGVPDLLVYAPNLGRNVLVEIKDGTLPPSKRRLTAQQRKWHRSWPRDVYVIHSVEEALRLVGAL